MPGVSAVRPKSTAKTRAKAASKGVPRRASQARLGPKARAAKASQPSQRASTRSAHAKLPALKTYREKRDFAVTSEPSGELGSATRATAGTQFVVQKHDARNLHYDFRLELDGVLLSWSVPKGPSLKPDEKRLAVRTEDHPLEYVDFEGIIPKGQYGGGTVIVWDRGAWSAEGDAHQGMKKGHLAFDLKGQKLRGRFHLVRTKGLKNKRENWLLFKGHDANEARASAPDIVQSRPESTLSGRTIEEVAKAPTKVWRSNKAQPSAKRSASSSTTDADDLLSKVKNLNIGVSFTNLEKVLYPEQNLRKVELVAYYASVAGVMLPHIQGRPLTLVRCPDGRHANCFYQKHAAAGVPSVVRRVSIPERDQKNEAYLVADRVPALLALPQMGALEIHTWPCHADKVELPDQFVFDLDPAADVGFAAVIAAAQEMRERLSELRLESFVKTTGGKGLHVVLPVKRHFSWEAHKAFARGISVAMAKESPKKYLTSMRKDLRGGRVFLDYLRNSRGATAVAPYSTRAREGATVATPLSWDELTADLDPKAFDVRSVLQRVNQPDPWREYSKLTAQSIDSKALRSVGVKD